MGRRGAGYVGGGGRSGMMRRGKMSGEKRSRRCVRGMMRRDKMSGEKGGRRCVRGQEEDDEEG